MKNKSGSRGEFNRGKSYQVDYGNPGEAGEPGDPGAKIRAAYLSSPARIVLPILMLLFFAYKIIPIILLFNDHSKDTQSDQIIALKKINTKSDRPLVDGENQLLFKASEKRLASLEKRKPDSPLLYSEYANLASQYEELKMFPQAEAAYKKAYQHTANAYHTYNWNELGDYRINYTNMLQDQGRNGEAVKLLKAALVNDVKEFGEKGLVPMHILENLPRPMNAAGQYKDEENTCNHIMALLKESGQEGTYMYDDALYALGDSYRGQSRKEEARAKYQEALRLSKTIPNNSLTTHNIEESIKSL